MKLKLTRRQRLELTTLFYELKIEGDPISWSKLFNRSRLALGLTPIMTLLTNQKSIDPRMVDDAETVHEIEEATADFLRDKVAAVMKRPAQIVLLSDVFESISERGEDPKGTPYSAKDEQWEAPEDLMGSCLGQAVAAARAKKIPDAEIFARLQSLLAPSNT